MLMLLTAFLTWLFYDVSTEKIAQDFNAQMSNHVFAIKNEASRIQSGLEHWQNLYAELGIVNEEGFRKIARDYIASNPAIFSVAWVPKVEHAQRALYEETFEMDFFSVPFFLIDQVSDESLIETVRDLNIGDLKTTMPVQPVYFPALFIEPSSYQKAFLGLDYLNVPDFRAEMPMTDALQQGDTKALPVFPNLVGGDFSPAVNLIVPVLIQHNPALDERTVKGVISVLVSVNTLIKSLDIYDPTSNYFLNLRDVTSEEKGVGLSNLFKLTPESTAEKEYAYQREIDFFDRKWVFDSMPSKEYMQEQRGWAHVFIGVIGLLLTWLYFIYAMQIKKRTQRIKDMVDKRTSQLRKANEKLRYANERLAEITQLDALTGIYNRRAFDDNLLREWKRANRQGKSLALIMIDVDHFKAFNDHYGHVVGDECLQKIAKTLEEECSRSGDMVARYGGEEFAVILPNSGPNTIKVAERCRAAVEALNIEHLSSSVGDCVTVSLGMSSIVPEQNSQPVRLVEAADKALYLAKVQGRNRVLYQDINQLELSL